jgi:acyl carrier protein
VSALVEQASLNGVRIVTEAADVGDGNQLNAVISRIGRGDAAPLRVVIHAAGEVEDGPLHTQTSRSLESALRTKVVGARLLGELTRDHPLLLTVYYSSIASLVGSAGQAGYASANAFLDGMAEERNARGHYTVSVNWGAWAGDGMAGELSAAMKARIERQGIRLMAPSAALATLEESLVAGLPRAVIADVDWMRFASQFPDGSAAGRFYSRFASSSIAEKGGSYARVGYESAENDLEQRAISPETSTSRAQAEIASIRRGMRSERQGLMEQLVRAAARRVLDLSEGRPIPADLPLQDMGLDSLMALELRNLLASAMDRSLSATLLFDYPSVRKLSTYLLGLLLIEGEEEHSNHVYAVATALGSGFNSELAEMTDEQAEEMLLAELEERRG